MAEGVEKNTEAFPAIHGFEITKEIGHGSTSRVYHAIRSGQDYAIKVHNKKDLEAAIQFRKEAAALARFNHPCVVHVVESGETESGLPYLVMEYVEGKTLDQMISKGPLAESDLLLSARGLALTLQEIHRHRLVHRDIKPSNVILTASGQIKLIDLGFAAQVERNLSQSNENTVVGTLLYCPPEQSGMIQRPIDGRSDLYAMGGLLFHCATGRPPFTGRSAADLVHQHLTEKPANAHDLNPSIRPIVASIISKLLSKDPDDRYQSGQSLFYDLERLSELETTASPQLGSGASTIQIIDEIPLVGRQENLAALHAAWKKAKQGHGNVIQIKGEAGSGKSRLSRELTQAARTEKALILAGKAQQFERTPFGPLREALNDYAQQLLKLDPGEQKEKTIQSLHQWVLETDSALALQLLSSGFKKLLNQAPAAWKTMNSSQDSERFLDRIADFFIKLAQGTGPVLFFVDDIQWLDDGTLQILRKISHRLKEIPCLIVATSRDDQASAAALSRFEEAMAGVDSVKIALRPLSEKESGELISLHLGGSHLSGEITKQIHLLSHGNPLATTEYVRAFLNQALLCPTVEGWVLDMRRFHEVNLPKDVIQLLLDRSSLLSAETLQVLEYAAVMGKDFDDSLLSESMGIPHQEIKIRLSEALQASLVEQKEASCSFIHDRVHEAFLQPIPEKKRKDIHQKIGESMEKRQPEARPSDRDLMLHFLQGHEEKNQRRFFQIGFSAGEFALEQSNYKEAFDFLERSHSAAKTLGLPEADLLNLHRALGIAAMKTGRHQLALSHFRSAMQTTGKLEDRIDIFIHLAANYTSEGKNIEAWEECRNALRVLKMPYPSSVLGSVLQLIRYAIMGWFVSNFSFGRKPVAAFEADRLILISKVHNTGSVLALLLGRPLQMILCVIREVYNAQYLKPSAQTANAYALMAMTMGMMGNIRSVRKYVKIADDMTQQLGGHEMLGTCAHTFGCAIEYAGDNIEGQQRVLQAFPMVRKYGDSFFRAANIAHICFSYYHQGKSRQVVAWCESTLEDFLQTDSAFFQSAVFAIFSSQLSLLGRHAEAQTAAEKMLQAAERIPNVKAAQAYPHQNALLARLDQEDFGEGLEKSIEAVLATASDDYHGRSAFIVVGYVRLEQLLRAKNPKEKVRARKALKKAVARMGSPPPLSKTAVQRCHHLALQSALAREAGKHKKAALLLDEAEGLAERSDGIWGLWSIARERARLALCRNDLGEMKKEGFKALQIAKEQGWINRAGQVAREFKLEGLTAPSEEAGSSMASSTTMKNSKRAINQGRSLDALLRVSQASLRVLDPEEHARLALDEVLKILGAERTFLFLKDETKDEGGQLKIKAGRAPGGVELTELRGYSSTVVEKVRLTQAPLIVSGTDEGEALGSESAVLQGLRSILAAPVMAQGRLLGVLYLDSKVVKGLFTEDDLEILQAIGNHIAVHIETIRAAKLEIEQQALRKDLEAKKAVQRILDNLDQGFLVFDDKGVIQPGIAKASEKVLGAPVLEGHSIAELLQVEAGKKEDIQKWIAVLFQEALLFEKLKKLGPCKLERSEGKYVELDYRPIRSDGKKKIEQVILIATDKTKEKKLEEKARDEALFARRVVSILKDRSSFFRVVRDMKECLGILHAELGGNKASGSIDASEVFRQMHSIKGSAATFCIEKVRALAHEFESRLSESRDEKAQGVMPSMIEPLRTGVDEIEKALEAFLEENKEIIGSATESQERGHFVPDAKMVAAFKLLQKELPRGSEALEYFEEHIFKENVARWFHPFESTVRQVAEKQKKQVGLEIADTGLQLWMQPYEKLIGSLVHAFRNAVDHGIESSDEREERGKQRQGKILVSFLVEAGSWFVIKIEDDGRGVDPQIIQKIAHEKGVVNQEAASRMSPHEVIQLIFAKGFSSKSEVSDISGRGVGLDAVRAEAEKLQGTSWVESELGRGTRLFVRVPLITLSAEGKNEPRLAA